METRPFFKRIGNILGKVVKGARDKFHTPIIPGEKKPEIQQSKNSGGSGMMRRRTRRMKAPDQHAWKKLFGGLAVPPW